MISMILYTEPVISYQECLQSLSVQKHGILITVAYLVLCMLMFIHNKFDTVLNMLY